MIQDCESSMSTYEDEDVDANAGLPIFKVLRVDPCALEILKHLSLKDLVRSESVCRAWQYAVHYHLENYCAVKCFCVDSQPLVTKTCIIKNKDYYVLSLYKKNPHSIEVVKKLRSCIKQVFIFSDHYPEQVLKTIATECFTLMHVEIQGLILNDIEYFFSLIESEKFKSLKIDLSKNRYEWDSECLLSAIPKFKNITSFEIFYFPSHFLDIVHLLFIGMPKLEILKLHRSVNKRYENIELSAEFIESISRLYELKRLYISHNAGVNDLLLEALAFGCKKLEYLNIEGCRLGCIGKSGLTARGLAALCRRSTSAITTLDFTHFFEKFEYTKIDSIKFNKPLCQELEDMCCVNLRNQHLELKDSVTGQKMWKIQGRSGCIAVDAQDPRQALTIILGGFLLLGLSSFHN